jgi:3-hydroxyisobutyrate dehydrogenase-like beta-hydroxyacid dehydrogenase
MSTVGLVGAGYMGSGLGWSLREGGESVVTTLAGRSARTGTLARQVGLVLLEDLDSVVRAADVLLVVVPPESAVAAATTIAESLSRTGASPLVADLNAIAPSTMERVASIVSVDTVDGSISGSPPNVRKGGRIYLSGPRAAEVAGLAWHGIVPVVVGDRIGTASAVKMCTASVYKGLSGLMTQALRAAKHYDVADHVLADLTENAGYRPARQVTMAATKSWRFVGEMREIAATQGAAGLPAELFEAMAMVFDELARTDLARDDPEAVQDSVSAADMLARLVPAQPA